MANLRFTQIVLKNWKNFREADVPLQERMFLAGPNASGKSNFLKAFRFLQGLASPGGGLVATVARPEFGGVKGIRCLAARRDSAVGLEVAVGDGEEPERWRYEIEFAEKDRKTGTPVLKKERVLRAGKELLARPGEKDNEDPRRLEQTHLEQINENRAFRELADFFASTRYMHVVPQLIREPGRWEGRPNDPFGSDLIEQIAAAQVKTRRSRLRRLAAALAIAVPQLETLELETDARGVPHLKGKFKHWRPKGAWQTEDFLSDGTLRLVGLLWGIVSGGGPLLLEEPELSLHSDLVRNLPQMFARVQLNTGRQIIMSTHSADMLDGEGIELKEVLLFVPREQEGEGTEVKPAATIKDAQVLMDTGKLTMSEIVLPKAPVRSARKLPAIAEQLTLL